MNKKIYIKYMRGNKGPYMTVFDQQELAEDWIRNNPDVHITGIDILW